MGCGFSEFPAFGRGMTYTLINYNIKHEVVASYLANSPHGCEKEKCLKPVSFPFLCTYSYILFQKTPL